MAARRGATHAPRPPRPFGASCHRGCSGRTWAAAKPEGREQPCAPTQTSAGLRPAEGRWGRGLVLLLDENPGAGIQMSM